MLRVCQRCNQEDDKDKKVSINVLDFYWQRRLISLTTQIMRPSCDNLVGILKKIFHWKRLWDVWDFRGVLPTGLRLCLLLLLSQIVFWWKFFGQTPQKSTLVFFGKILIKQWFADLFEGKHTIIVHMSILSNRNQSTLLFRGWRLMLTLNRPKLRYVRMCASILLFHLIRINTLKCFLGEIWLFSKGNFGYLIFCEHFFDHSK